MSAQVTSAGMSPVHTNVYSGNTTNTSATTVISVTGAGKLVQLVGQVTGSSQSGYIIVILDGTQHLKIQMTTYNVSPQPFGVSTSSANSYPQEYEMQFKSSCVIQGYAVSGTNAVMYAYAVIQTY